MRVNVVWFKLVKWREVDRLKGYLEVKFVGYGDELDMEGEREGKF